MNFDNKRFFASARLGAGELAIKLRTQAATGVPALRPRPEPVAVRA
jgi:hypothetical protein